MGNDLFEVSINALKLVIIFLGMVQAVPILVWLERRGSAFIQNRLGPNRVGPLGLTQLLADAVKFLLKEEFSPAKSRKFIYYAAPVVTLVPGALAFSAIPMGPPISVPEFSWLGLNWGPYTFAMQGYEIGIGIVFILGVSSLAAYGVLMAGWGSSNKYSLMGALRASAQIISYELPLGLAIVGVLLVYGTFDLNEMVRQQSGPLAFQFFGSLVQIPFLPNWGIFYQPLAALLLFAAFFAEANRLPFDLAESEAELVAGFHTEYGGFKMLMFFIGEYGHMIVASGLMVTFFFGGYHFPGLDPVGMGSSMQAAYGVFVGSLLTSLLFLAIFLAKVAVFLWIFIQVRWTLPRFKYNTLMDLGWKTMLPWALANTILTAVFVAFA